MAVAYGTVHTVRDLLHQIINFVTTQSNFTTGNAWELISPSKLLPDTEEVILKGVGKEGKDAIYIGMKIAPSNTYNGDKQKDILLMGYSGYDPGLHWYEQPDAIPVKIQIDSHGELTVDYTGLPCIPLVDNIKLTYWLTANSSRISIRVKMAYQYEGAYLGFFEPISVAANILILWLSAVVHIMV